MRERMGSGGPRGLQILLSVTDRGRGGFDSHTFPPSRRAGARFVSALALTLLAGMLVGSNAGAQVRADSALARPPARRVATPAGERPRPWHQQPWSIMARSAIVPGWGQLENRRPLKAVLAAALEGVAGVHLVRSWQEVNRASRREAQALALGDAAGAAAARADYDRAFNRRANAGWILGLGIALSMMDAYVDAHLIQFDADFGPDPALPPDNPGADAGAPRSRVSVRVSFTGP